ncbi:MAG: GNAT family N-acetyltransferase [Eubacteriales bacterium]|nr:GNAT family N-acetyltransferase [Eubacteriales bacterium]
MKSTAEAKTTMLTRWKRARANRKKKTDIYPPLLSQRLVLRMFELGDTADLYEYARSPIVGPMAGWTPHRSMEESRQVVHQFINHGDVWAIVEKRSGRVIGSIGLHADSKRDVPNTRMLGYALGEPYWGQGYATEAAEAVLKFAFEDLGCPLVSAFHNPQNDRSKRVIQKLGFLLEGRLRLAGTLPDGTVTDEDCYSMTRAEYATRERKTEPNLA